jgi:hypothetical protein
MISEALVNAAAQSALSEVETLAAKLGAAESQLEMGYGTLAVRLFDISKNRYWEGAYKNFGEFMSHLTEKYKIGRAQLYSYLSSARELEGAVTEAELSQMGISKALVLRDAVKNGDALPVNALPAALDAKVTVKDLRKILFESGNLMADEEGTWYDTEMEFYVTGEERAEILRGFDIARKVDPPVSETLTEHAQRKEIMLRLCREFIGTYEREVYGQSVPKVPQEPVSQA